MSKPMTGNFRMRKAPEWNVYDCVDCLSAGVPHEVKYVPGGSTGPGSYWGSDVPREMRECSGCGRQDGPWVSADLVGGCW